MSLADLLADHGLFSFKLSDFGLLTGDFKVLSQATDLAVKLGLCLGHSLPIGEHVLVTLELPCKLLLMLDLVFELGDFTADLSVLVCILVLALLLTVGTQLGVHLVGRVLRLTGKHVSLEIDSARGRVLALDLDIGVRHKL